MPYKDPERKRQWEREHRERRNSQRRKQHLAARAKRGFLNPAPDPISIQQTKRGWNAIIGLAIGLGFILLAALTGMHLSVHNQPKS